MRGDAADIRILTYVDWRQCFQAVFPLDNAGLSVFIYLRLLWTRPTH
jgi:hypothetical protein